MGKVSASFGRTPTCLGIWDLIFRHNGSCADFFANVVGAFRVMLIIVQPSHSFAQVTGLAGGCGGDLC